MYPLPGEKYRHYKGGTYEVISLAQHTETQEKMVVYKSINFGTVYVRPLDIWNSTIPNGILGQVRFELIDGKIS
jgi:hypothetical protein